MIKNDFGLFQSVHGFFFFQLDSLQALRYGHFSNNLLLCYRRKKESHTGLEKHESE